MSKKLPIYFSDGAWSSLQTLMGQDGKPSPTINALLEFTQNPENAKRILNSKPVQISVASERISAGFPSPAQDYVEQKIDLNSFLVTNELATFIVEVNSQSMLNAGIDIDDKLIVDRSIDAVHDDIVVAMIDNDFTVKRLQLEPAVYLKAENPEFSDIHLKDGQELLIWGVVTNIIKTTRKRKK